MSDAIELLREASTLYDTSPALERRAASVRGFKGAADWMCLALEILRGDAGAPIPALRGIARWGYIKYGAASALALSWALAAVLLSVPWLALLGVLLFYAVEAQMVFLFPGRPRWGERAALRLPVAHGAGRRHASSHANRDSHRRIPCSSRV